MLNARSTRPILLALAAIVLLLLTAADGEAIVPITKAQAIAYARAINLHVGDVPGMPVTAPAESEGGKEQRSSAGLAQCAGVASQGRQLVDISSPTFGSGGTLTQKQVSSSVAVLPSAADAAQEFAAIHSARGRACITRFARHEFAHESKGLLRYQRVVSAPLPAPVAGIGASFGLRLTVTLAVPRTGHRFYFYLDFLGILAGPAEIGLETSGFSRPVSPAIERRLMLTLDGRVKARKL